MSVKIKATQQAKSLPLLPVLMVASLASTGAFGQSPVLEEVMVTAQKRDQSLHDVPIAISVFSQGDLENKRIENLEDIGSFAPNVKVTRTASSTTAAAVAIRGSVTSNPAVTWEPTVGIYLDGVYVAKALGNVFNVADLSRIEVLRGPQGTLYGKNTTGGAINLLTEQPAEDFGLKVKAGQGNYGLTTGFLSVNLPELDLAQLGTIRSKVTGTLNKRDGLYDIRPSTLSLTAPSYLGGFPIAPNPPRSDEHNAIDSKTIRADILWQMTDKLSVRYTIDDIDIDNKTSKNAMTFLDPTIGPFAGLLPIGLEAYLFDETKNSSYAVDDAGDYERSKSQSQSVFINYDLDSTEFLGEASIKYIGNSRDLDWSDWADYDGTPFPIAQGGRDMTYEQKSHELQLVGSRSNVDYVLGLYSFSEKADSFSSFQVLGYLGSPFDDKTYGLKGDSYAVFGQLDWRPSFAALQDRLKLTLGLRWTQEEKDSYIDHPGNFSVEADKKFTNTSPTLVASWDISNEANIYAKYAEGWKAGGFNGEASSAASFTSGYGDESMETYEIGIKSQWLENKLRFNAAAFYNQLDDMQLNVFTGGITVSTEVRNAGSANIKGFEAEFTYQPFTDLTLTANYGYLDAEYKEYNEFDPVAGTIRNFAKERDLPNVPRHNYNVAANYLVYRANWADVNAYVDYSYIDNHVTFVSPEQNKTSSIRSYGLLNGRLALKNMRVGDGSLELAVWGKNLTDEEYRVNSIPFTTFTTSFYGDPRTYGVELQYVY